MAFLFVRISNKVNYSQQMLIILLLLSYLLKYVNFKTNCEALLINKEY
jgi:hypothetical protein